MSKNENIIEVMIRILLFVFGVLVGYLVFHQKETPQIIEETQTVDTTQQPVAQVVPEPLPAPDVPKADEKERQTKPQKVNTSMPQEKEESLFKYVQRECNVVESLHKQFSGMYALDSASYHYAMMTGFKEDMDKLVIVKDGPSTQTLTLFIAYIKERYSDMRAKEQLAIRGSIEDADEACAHVINLVLYAEQVAQELHLPEDKELADLKAYLENEREELKKL